MQTFGWLDLYATNCGSITKTKVEQKEAYADLYSQHRTQLELLVWDYSWFGYAVPMVMVRWRNY